MAGEEQERFEDYQELERYIEDLQAGRRAALPHDLTPEQASIYRMVGTFRAGKPEVAEPRPAFVSDLFTRLQAELQAQPQSLPLAVEAEPEPTTRLTDRNAYRAGQAIPSEAVPPTTPIQPQPLPFPPVPRPEANNQYNQSRGGTKKPARKPIVSRRSLLSHGAVAAASLAAGVGATLIARQVSNPPQQWPKLVDGVPISWHEVAPAADVKTNAVKFVSEGVVGYVVRDDSPEPGQNEIMAFSAACTHMGCIVQWNEKANRFDCPCHNGRFTRYGEPDPNGSITYLRRLPTLTVKIDDGKVYVAVPEVTSL